jgi:FtsP/CotA-like multicopper oxidase with cupredoxin domain
VLGDINEPPYHRRVPGTVIYARPGDRLKIHVVNADSQPQSFHMHGLQYGIEPPQDGGGWTTDRSAQPDPSCTRPMARSGLFISSHKTVSRNADTFMPLAQRSFLAFCLLRTQLHHDYLP